MIKKTFKKIHQNNKGFTIIESLVAIFILILSITGPMAFTQSGLRASFVSRDQITAFYLAQDAIEYIKNVRDNNSLLLLDVSVGNDPEDGWLDGLENCIVTNADTDSGCTVDTLDEVINSCGSSSEDGCLGSDEDGSSDTPLKKTGDFGFLGIGTGENSIFSREIRIMPVDSVDIANANEVEITVIVRWNTNETIGSRKIVVKESMFDWATGGLD